MARFIVVAPLIFVTVSFVLSSLTLFAGQKPGFMEDYAVVRLNTSKIGHPFFDSAQDKEKGNTRSTDGLLGDLRGWLDGKKDGAKNKINEITGGIADKFTRKLGLAEWYSLHIMDTCHGSFAPNSTDPSPSLNTTNCTMTSSGGRFNLTRLVDHELGAGPLKLSLSDINWPDSLQDTLDVLNNALMALFIIYSAAMGLTGLSMLSHAAVIFLPCQNIIVLFNFVVASLAAVACLVGSAITSISASKTANNINKWGARIGISAERGEKFYIIGWIATSFMLGTTAFWLAQFLLLRRRQAKAMRNGAKGGVSS